MCLGSRPLLAFKWSWYLFLEKMLNFCCSSLSAGMTWRDKVFQWEYCRSAEFAVKQCHGILDTERVTNTSALHQCELILLTKCFKDFRIAFHCVNELPIRYGKVWFVVYRMNSSLLNFVFKYWWEEKAKVRISPFPFLICVHSNIDSDARL